MRLALRLCCLCAVLFLGHPLSAAAEPRVALIIANGGYGPDLGALRNPVNDGELVAKALKHVGFKVTLIENGTQAAMKRAVVDFGQALSDAGPSATALFYYAGHGLQVRGENYLVPIGSAMKREGDADLMAVSADSVLKELDFSGNRVRIVILDACRNNPLARSMRSTSAGLAKIDAPIGSFVAYSTAPGSVASDGDGTNSPFAMAFAAEVQRPGAAIEETFRNVRAKVIASTDSAQIPWDSSSLTAPFYFSTPGSGGSSDGAANDGIFWDSIKDSADAADFAAYLKKFPNGTFADLAKNRMTALQKANAPVTQVATASTGVDSTTTRSEVIPAGLSAGNVKQGATFQDCKDCPSMVVVAPGGFLMGSPDSEIGRNGSEGPQHKVTIPRPLAFSKYTVTVGEFRAFAKATGRGSGKSCYYYKDEIDEWIEKTGLDFDNPGFRQTDQYPAVCLNFGDAQAYADWLSKKTGHKYRLPSEAEWEYAARAGSAAAHFWGDSEAQQCTYANGADQSYHKILPRDPGFNKQCDDGYPRTAPVGSFKPNGFGLYDMLGNSWQMTEDCATPDYSGAPSDGSARAGTCDKNTIRGGSWGRGPQFLRSAQRGAIDPDIRSVSNSIRLVREL